MSAAAARPIGQDHVLAKLEAMARKSGRGENRGLPHAVLFTGSAGVGKWAAARWWTRLLKCATAAACDPVCPDCRRIGAGTHPDVVTLEPEAPGKALKIDEVRELIRLMSLKTVGQGPRIALVRDAHELTIDAQSALLKLLEEPPGSALIILVTENPSGLLATVRSRCQAFRFGAVAAQDLETLLRAAGRDAETARRAAALARGRVGLALDYSPELVADRDELILSVEQLPGGDGLGAEPLVAALAERMKQGRPGLEELLEWTIHRIETAVGFPPGAESPALAEILQNSSVADFPALLTRAESIQRTLEALDRNANSRLALRDLLFDLENG